MNPARWFALIAALVLSSACSSPATSAIEEPDGPDGAVMAGEARLPECGPPPPAVPAPDGVPLLPEVVVTGVSEQDPVVLVRGWIGATPREVRAGYEQLPETTLVASEDEIVEAELLLDNGPRRVYVKASSVCDGGSLLELWSSASIGAVPELRGGGP